MDRRRQPHHRHAGILAPDHARRAGVVLLAGHDHSDVPDADDGLDDAEAQPGAVEDVALLDMGFEIAAMAAGLDRLAPPAGEPGLGQGLAQRRPVATYAAVDLDFAEVADERAAAEEGAVMALLVGPGRDLDAEPGAIGIGGEGAGEFEPVDDAERAVEPAAIGLGFEMRADQEAPLRLGIAADDVADPVDRRVEPCRAKPLGEPVARFDIDRGIGRAVVAGLVAAEFGEPPQIGQDPPPIDLRHSLDPSQTIGLSFS